MIARATNENAPLERGSFGATRQKLRPNHNAEKALATIRAKLCIAGGQTLHVASDGAYFVVTPWQQIVKFDDFPSLQTYVAKVSP